MGATAPLVRIATPTGKMTPGRGFYQVDEDILLVHTGAFLGDRQFFSSLECEHLRLDIDRHGRLISLESRLPRRQWPVAQAALTPPLIAEPVDIRWLDFRTALPQPRITCNPDRRSLCLAFSATETGSWHALADSVFVQIADSREATALFITDIEDDLAGRALARFREQTNRALGRDPSFVIPSAL